MPNSMIDDSQFENNLDIGKRVLVLLATFNGIKWLPEQVDSILGQTGVSVRLLVSDDMSIDGTAEWLRELSSQDDRVILLPHLRKFGGAATNFYRLILDAGILAYDYFAFSDQDDIWEHDKLRRHILIASNGGFDGVSSNVTAFWPNGKSTVIMKTSAQRELDYLFESAGPGCTYLITPWLIGELRKVLLDSDSGAANVALHDWLVYAVCRSSGRKWHIDNISSVKYRQHESNEFGANHGVRAKLSRIGKLRSGWYRGEVIKVLKVCMTISSQDTLYTNLLEMLSARTIRGRLKLLSMVNKARRKTIDRIALLAAIAFGLF